MTKENRIGSRCWYQPSHGRPWVGGVLHFWGQVADTDGAECVGVVEDEETGKCTDVPVRRISFGAEKPTT